jgi:hypothetical protein
MARGSDSDWDQCYAWNREAKALLDQIHGMIAPITAVPTEVILDVDNIVKNVAALVDGVFGTADRARAHYQREAEKLHEARERWEDEHG